MLRALIKELRIHQWTKNALVAVPVVLAPGVPSIELIVRALLAALAFSLCASAGYVLNDLLDVEADRAHATKKERPFASGALPLKLGPPLFVALLLLGIGGAFLLLPLRFTLMLIAYFIATISYSLYFKRILLLDVLLLAGMYTQRILAGGMATSIPISAWLLSFSMFFFTSLAFAKRYVELNRLVGDGKIQNRNYYKVDLTMVGNMGPASGYLAMLVFSLYVAESGVPQSVYQQPVLLWLAVPVLLYWISRIWILTGRGQMHDDPVRFATKDPITLLAAVVMGAIFAAARFAPDWVGRLFAS
ncbi:MAG TPA: UbiA family prenyltransferase [Polyangiales bacterium]|nr:UbiA family prenyltransferase [Polyangiales bacterium]